jgi:hypothetical protein
MKTKDLRAIGVQFPIKIFRPINAVLVSSASATALDQSPIIANYEKFPINLKNNISFVMNDWKHDTKDFQRTTCLIRGDLHL